MKKFIVVMAVIMSLATILSARAGEDATNAEVIAFFPTTVGGTNCVAIRFCYPTNWSVMRLDVTTSLIPDGTNWLRKARTSEVAYQHAWRTGEWSRIVEYGVHIPTNSSSGTVIYCLEKAP